MIHGPGMAEGEGCLIPSCLGAPRGIAAVDAHLPALPAPSHLCRGRE